MVKPKPRALLSDVAAKAGISMSAASMALANSPQISLETRRRVRLISQKLGYRPSQRRRNRAGQKEQPEPLTRRIGFVCLGESMDRPLNSHHLMNITSCASQLELRLEAAFFENIADGAQLVSQVMRFIAPLEGVAVCGIVTAEVLNAIAAASIPCVVLGDPLLERPPVDVVSFDHHAAGRCATNFLLARGHRRIAFVCDTLFPGGSNSKWLDAYRLAHLNANMPLDPALVHNAGEMDRGGEVALDAMLKLPDPPTAYLVVNPWAALALKVGLRAHQRNAVVLTLQNEISSSQSIDGEPAVIYPLQSFCTCAIHRLLYLCDHAGEPPAWINVPFDTINMDIRDATRSS